MARDEVFLRPPNHLNPMLTDVAKYISFGDIVRGEDFDWAIRLARSGFLTREYNSNDDSRIHYIYNMGERIVDPKTLEVQKTITYDKMLSMVYLPNGESTPQPQPKQGGLRLTPRGFVSK
jgi:hypothetical protein